MKQSHANITGSRHAYLAPLGKRRLEVNLECHTPAYCPLSTRLVHPARPEHAEARKSRLRCLPEHRQSLEGIDEHRSRQTNRRHTLRQKRGETRHDDKTGLDTTTKAIARLPSQALHLRLHICVRSHDRSNPGSVLIVLHSLFSVFSFGKQREPEPFHARARSPGV